MRNILVRIFTILLLSIIITSCNNGKLSSTNATATSTPSSETTATISPPTETLFPTKEKTFTPTPTFIPSEVDDMLGDMRVNVPGGGFSVMPPFSENFDYQYDSITASDESISYLIKIRGFPFYTESSLPDQIVDEYLDALERSTSGNLQKENNKRIIIDSFEGTVYDITGDMLNIPVIGQAFIVMPNEGQYIFGFGVLKITEPGMDWKDTGGPVFNDLINSILIINTIDLPECTTSPDQTYGLSKENPIKVGGKAFGGPSRETTYLENLIGPNNEQLTYERVGSSDFGDTVLDTYEISGMKEKVLLYIDEYSFTDLFAPYGFSCKGPFLLEKP